MRLSDVAASRENNFNLIRMIAAWAVLVSHSWVLSLGSPATEPLRQALHTTPGGIGVDIFFITSGFLVTGSLFSRRSVLEFIWARTLRIYPALWVMLILLVGVLGARFTTLSLHDYFSSSGTWHYLARNAVLFFGAAYKLPGVFERLPYNLGINGSLWTMFYELRMYALLVLAWLAARWLPGPTERVFRWMLLIAALVGAVAHVAVHFTAGDGASPFWHLFFMFFSGAAMYVMKRRIALAWPAFAAAAGALLLSCLDPDAFFLVYSASLAYILFFLAYVPAGATRGYNRLGDYSYGIYIYAFPVQQTLVALNPGISPWRLLLWSSVITLIFAVASWTLLEERMLRLKSQVVMHTRRLLRLQA